MMRNEGQGRRDKEVRDKMCETCRGEIRDKRSGRTRGERYKVTDGKWRTQHDGKRLDSVGFKVIGRVREEDR